MALYTNDYELSNKNKNKIIVKDLFGINSNHIGKSNNHNCFNVVFSLE